MESKKKSKRNIYFIQTDGASNTKPIKIKLEKGQNEYLFGKNILSEDPKHVVIPLRNHKMYSDYHCKIIHDMGRGYFKFCNRGKDEHNPSFSFYKCFKDSEYWVPSGQIILLGNNTFLGVKYSRETKENIHQKEIKIIFYDYDRKNYTLKPIMSKKHTITQVNAISFGQKATKDIHFIADKEVSRNHGKIYLNKKGQVVYMDTRSMNGTWFKMYYNFRIALNDEQEIRIGEDTF